MSSQWTPETIRALGPTTDVPTLGSILSVSRWKAYQISAANTASRSSRSWKSSATARQPTLVRGVGRPRPTTHRRPGTQPTTRPQSHPARLRLGPCHEPPPRPAPELHWGRVMEIFASCDPPQGQVDPLRPYGTPRRHPARRLPARLIATTALVILCITAITFVMVPRNHTIRITPADNPAATASQPRNVLKKPVPGTPRSRVPAPGRPVVSRGEPVRAEV